MSGEFIVRNIQVGDRSVVEQHFTQLWGSDMVVSKGRLYNPFLLPGFIAEQAGEIIGIAHYSVEGRFCELVTLTSLRPGRGVGAALVEKVKHAALEAGCEVFWLITTNDNLQALGFYQKRGFRLAVVYPNAIEFSRKLKPQIPLLGYNDIPIRDEVELQMILDPAELTE